VLPVKNVMRRAEGRRVVLSESVTGVYDAVWQPSKGEWQFFGGQLCSHLGPFVLKLNRGTMRSRLEKQSWLFILSSACDKNCDQSAFVA
jgi:hypothetical protein